MPENERAEQSPEVRPVRLDEIKVDDTNVRQSDRNKDVDLLAESIKEHGLLQPVVLMGEWGKPPYHLIVGQRRFLAHDRLNRTHILARFVPVQSKDDARVMSLIENLQRVEVNYADIAAAVTHLWDICRDDRKVAKTLNLHLRTVRDYLRIELFATPRMKQAISRNPKLKPVAKRALLAAQNDPQKAEKLFLAVKEMAPDTQRRMVDYGSSHPKASADALISEAKKAKVQESIVLALDDSLRGALSTAQKALAMDWGDIASRALREWLAEKGFLRH
jgi:ParB/RepB/Spo0J family partition protein